MLAMQMKVATTSLWRGRSSWVGETLVVRKISIARDGASMPPKTSPTWHIACGRGHAILGHHFGGGSPRRATLARS